MDTKSKGLRRALFWLMPGETTMAELTAAVAYLEGGNPPRSDVERQALEDAPRYEAADA